MSWTYASHPVLALPPPAVGMAVGIPVGIPVGSPGATWWAPAASPDPATPPGARSGRDPRTGAARVQRDVPRPRRGISGGRRPGRAEQAERAEVDQVGGGAARLPRTERAGHPALRGEERDAPGDAGSLGSAQRCRGQVAGRRAGCPAIGGPTMSARREWEPRTEKPSDSEEGALPSPTFLP